MNASVRTGVVAAYSLLLASVQPGSSQGLGALAADHPVKARLVADVASVAAGESFSVGVELQMEEGWHTYWRYSGDAGYPTTIEWDLPAGLSAGATQWPGPHKYKEQDLVVYGYADDVLLISDVTASGDLEQGLAVVPVAARVSWLVCREICIPGNAALTLQLPIEGDSSVSSVDRVIFDRFRSDIPTPLNDEDLVQVSHELSHSGDETFVAAVRISAARGGGRAHAGGVNLDFFPSAAHGADLFPGKWRLEDDGSVLVEVELAALGEATPDELEGVVVYEGDDRSLRYRTVRLALEEAPRQVGLLEGALASRAGTASRPLALYLLMAVVGGFILNLMPCVLPVISLKILGFVSQAGEERGRIRQLGFMFSAGVVATFAALAAVVVLVKAGGQEIGWGFQFQSPAFILFLTALVFVLGLSLFGVVTVRLPGSSGGLVGRGSQEGMSGSFFNGVLATILATPCTAPFLGTSLGFAFSQSALTILGIFLAAGVGMALPYVALALQPGWIRFIPKPGEWMERFKQFMAFLLMATAVWLLWVLGKQLGMEAVVWTTAFLLCLGLASWILGQWVEDLRAGRRQRLVAWVGAISITVGGYVVFLHPLLEQPGPPGQVGPRSPNEVIWQPFSIEFVENLVNGDRHVFVDFTAEWCWTCKVNKRMALDDGRVRARFAELDVKLVRADWTNRNPQITKVLSAFGRAGVPLYVLFPGGRFDHPLVLPEILTPGIVLESLEKAVSLGAPAGDIGAAVNSVSPGLTGIHRSDG